MPGPYPTEDDEGRYLAVNAGRNAYLAGARWHDNPFDPDGYQWRDFHDWREGWDIEHKAAREAAKHERAA